MLKLTPLVKETYKLLRGSLPSTIQMKLDLHTTSDTVIGDPSQVQQVLMNLATNAVHAMREKGGSLLIGLSEGKALDMANGKYLLLNEVVLL